MSIGRNRTKPPPASGKAETFGPWKVHIYRW
jgi:hypothetical protein